MADLNFDVVEVANVPGCVLVKMAGAIDATTVLTFQSTLENLQLNGVTRFILDMEGIKYVNSTGLGSLVRLADQLDNEGGGFALAKIHPKVKVVFDMLGLNAFFKIFGSVDDAKGHFQQSAGAASSPAVARRPSAVARAPSGVGRRPAGAAPAHRQPSRAGGNRQPVQPPPKRQVAPPPRRGQQPAMPQQAGAGQLAPAPGGQFQARAITCQNCGVTLKIAQVGTFKCSRCFTVFSVQPTGNVEFTRTSRPTPLQMNLTCAEEVRQGLLLFLGAIAQRIGFDNNRVQQLQACVNEIVTHIAADAYGNNPQNTYSVLIAPMNGEMNIKFADHGRTLQAQNPNFFRQARSMLNVFDLKAHPQGGNIVTMKMTAF